MGKFTVNAVVEVEVSIEVNADSMFDALEKTKMLKVTDFIKIKGDWIDGNKVRVNGLYDNECSVKED